MFRRITLIVAGVGGLKRGLGGGKEGHREGVREGVRWGLYRPT